VPFVEINSIKDLEELLEFLQKGDHEFETVVIDSITEVNDIIKQEIEKKTGKPMQLNDW
jgi:hemerythrin-like domain-containing protein